MTRSCSECARTLDPRNRVGKCRSCFFRASATDPVLIAKRRETMRNSPRVRANIAAMARAKMAWCPLEYRAEARRLRRKIPAAEIRRVILAQVEADAQRYAQTGQLQQSRRAG